MSLLNYEPEHQNRQRARDHRYEGERHERIDYYFLVRSRIVFISPMDRHDSLLCRIPAEKFFHAQAENIGDLLHCFGIQRRTLLDPSDGSRINSGSRRQPSPRPSPNDSGSLNFPCVDVHGQIFSIGGKPCQAQNVKK